MTNDDKELLMLAAKAVVTDARRLPDAWPVRVDDDLWNPLIDDGDALRLAVWLRIHVATTPSYIEARYFDGGAWQRFRETVISMPATRRAIVRAAAEIGRGMA